MTLIGRIAADSEFNHLISFFPLLNKKVEDLSWKSDIICSAECFMTGSLFARWTEKVTLPMSVRNEVV